MTRKIKVGFLVSYDYELIKNSLPPVYEYADKIVLAVDKNQQTWSGNYFKIDDSFWQWIESLDTKHKIEIYKDSFCVEGLTSMQNETRERNMLGEYMGEGGWHVQIDSDEYFADFKHFVDFLHELDKNKRYINYVTMEWLTIFKKLTNGYLFVKDGGTTGLATTTPNYICARIIANPKKIVYSQRIIHESIGRTDDALLYKLQNWGHNCDFDIEGFFNYYKVINEKNYMFVRDFHPIEPEVWKKLDYIPSENIQSLLQNLRENNYADLLKVSKQENKIKKALRLCIPPIFEEIAKYNRSRKYKGVFNEK